MIGWNGIMLQCKYAESGLAITNSHTHVRPCCQYKFDVKELPSIDQVETFDQAMNNSHRKWLLKKLSQGKRVDECKSCWDLESNGIHSKRTNSLLDTGEINYISKPVIGKLQHIEMALDFTCNMTCRMCHPFVSSAWGQLKQMNKELDKVSKKHNYSTTQKGTAYRDNIIRLFENSDLSDLTWVKLTGGEPFYSKSLKRFCQLLIDKAPYQDLTLEVITNCSMFPSDEVLETLQKFKHVGILVSLDAIGSLAEVIRPPTPWNVTEEIFNKWKQTGFDMSLASTMTIMNINAMKDLVMWCEDNGLLSIGITPLRSPEWLNPYMLPLEIRENFKTGIEDVDKYILSNETVNTTKKLSWRVILESIDVQDNHFLKLSDVNPEIYNIIEDLYYEELATL